MKQNRCILNVCEGKQSSRITKEFQELPLAFQQGIPNSLFIPEGMGVGVVHSCIPGCWENRIKKDGLINGEVWKEAMAESHMGR